MTEGHSHFLTSGGDAETRMRVPSKEVFHIYFMAVALIVIELLLSPGTEASSVIRPEEAFVLSMAKQLP